MSLRESYVTARHDSLHEQFPHLDCVSLNAMAWGEWTGYRWGFRTGIMLGIGTGIILAWFITWVAS